jgi:hypothetical protein
VIDSIIMSSVTALTPRIAKIPGASMREQFLGTLNYRREKKDATDFSAFTTGEGQSSFVQAEQNNKLTTETHCPTSFATLRFTTTSRSEHFRAIEVSDTHSTQLYAQAFKSAGGNSVLNTNIRKRKKTRHPFLTIVQNETAIVT